MGMTRADAQVAASRRRRLLQYIAERPYLWQHNITGNEADDADEHDGGPSGAGTSIGASAASATMTLRPRSAGGESH